MPLIRQADRAVDLLTWLRPLMGCHRVATALARALLSTYM